MQKLVGMRNGTEPRLEMQAVRKLHAESPTNSQYVEYAALACEGIYHNDEQGWLL